jgi:hypothetical protein
MPTGVSTPIVAGVAAAMGERETVATTPATPVQICPTHPSHIRRNFASDERAFELLREASQRLNIKLTAVAEGVTYTGDLPS